MKLIDKSALVAEIEKVIDEPAPSHDQQCPWEDGYYSGLYKAESIIDTLEVKEVDLELITGWFDHIVQIADDRKTLNGVIMEDWAALDEIKCLARNSSEFIQKYYKAQKGE